MESASFTDVTWLGGTCILTYISAASHEFLFVKQGCTQIKSKVRFILMNNYVGSNTCIK